MRFTPEDFEDLPLEDDLSPYKIAQLKAEAARLANAKAATEEARAGGRMLKFTIAHFTSDTFDGRLNPEQAAYLAQQVLDKMLEGAPRVYHCGGVPPVGVCESYQAWHTHSSRLVNSEALIKCNSAA